MSDPIRGVFNILATPFAPDLQVDVASLRRLVNFQLERGAYGLTILGVLGEAAKLSVEERALVTHTVIETVNGRVPVIVGVSHPELTICIRLGTEAVSAGAAGVMLHAPKMDAPTDQAVYNFYAAFAEAVPCPIVVQDLPTANNITLSPALLARLAEGIGNVRHLKLEDPPLMQKISAVRAATDKYAIFGGLGGMFFLEELKRGAAGTMTGFAFTEVLVKVYQAFSTGDHATAEAIFDRYLPLIRYENQPLINLAIRKELLRLRGAIATSVLRPPFVGIDEHTADEIGWMLSRVGITDPSAILTL
jgi:4-hydroxy-tetrahydrodipicolinate synthase